jgi:hypothetical protein
MMCWIVLSRREFRTDISRRDGAIHLFGVVLSVFSE